MVEEGIREEGANSEITSNIVLQAVRKNKNFTRKRPNIQLVIIKIKSSFAPCWFFKSKKHHFI